MFAYGRARPADLEYDVVTARFGSLGGNADLDCHRLSRRRLHFDLLRPLQTYSFEAGHPDRDRSRGFLHVHDPQLVDVLDHPAGDLTRQRRAIADDIDTQIRTYRQAPDCRQEEYDEDAAVDQRAGTKYVCQDLPLAPVLAHRVFGRIADQSGRIAHLVHHLITTIDTGAATDALVLKSLA